jgi:hypothetical protein
LCGVGTVVLGSHPSHKNKNVARVGHQWIAAGRPLDYLGGAPRRIFLAL